MSCCSIDNIKCIKNFVKNASRFQPKRNQYEDNNQHDMGILSFGFYVHDRPYPGNEGEKYNFSQ